MPKSVLIVDDASFMRALLSDILTEEGFTVAAQAADGRSAIELFATHRPDVVTLDVNMPHVDGHSALEAMRRTDPEARVVMVTTTDQDAAIKKALLAGARDYLTKPFKRHHVVATLGRILRDDGTPQTFLEELVAWHELGEMLARNDLISTETLAARRAEVRDGTGPRNLLEALRLHADVGEEDLLEAYETGHKEVSLAFLLLRGKVVTLEQLRCALVILRRTGKNLGFTLVELGFCDKAALGEAMRKVPPSRLSIGE